MARYQHKLVAVYPDEASAKAAYQHFRAAGFGDAQLHRIAPHDANVDRKLEPDSRAVANPFIRAGIIGHVVGGALGLGLLAYIWLAHPSLFQAAPIIGPLMVVGYSAYMAALIWAFLAFRARQVGVDAQVSHALRQGYHVVVVHPSGAAQEKRGHEALRETPARSELRG